jgi:hypothetical protein
MNECPRCKGYCGVVAGCVAGDWEARCETYTEEICQLTAERDVLRERLSVAVERATDAEGEAGRYFDVIVGLSDTTIALLAAIESDDHLGWDSAVADAKACIGRTKRTFEAALAQQPAPTDTQNSGTAAEE